MLFIFILLQFFLLILILLWYVLLLIPTRLCFLPLLFIFTLQRSFCALHLQFAAESSPARLDTPVPSFDHLHTPVVPVESPSSAMPPHTAEVAAALHLRTGTISSVWLPGVAVAPGAAYTYLHNKRRGSWAFVFAWTCHDQSGETCSHHTRWPLFVV